MPTASQCPFLGHSTAQDNGTRACRRLPSSRHLPFPSPASSAPSPRQQVPGGTETRGLPWSCCSGLCSSWKRAGGSRDPFSGVLALFFMELHFLSVSDQTATSSEGVTAGYFLSDYLMPAQSTRARKLALENKSCATAQPLNTAHVGEGPQAVSLQPRRLLGCTATPHSPHLQG